MTFIFSMLVLSARSITSSMMFRVILEFLASGGDGSGEGDAETNEGESGSDDS